jgi:glycogen(starch) synthase
MRILFVSQEFPPETGWGGIGTYVDVMAEAIAAKGHDVHALSVVDGQPASTREARGVTIHRHPLPQPRSTRRLPPESWRRTWLPIVVARAIRSLTPKPEVVECPEWMAEGLIVGLQGHLPLVVRLHSSARQLFPFTRQGTAWRGFDGRLAFWLEEVSARRANVVVSTRSNLDEVSRWMALNEAAVHAIPYPVRLPDPSPMPSRGQPRITFVGRLEPRKGPEVVLRAAPQVLDVIPDARFVFVGRDSVAPGTPPSQAWLQREAERLGIGDSIELTGHLERTEVDDQIRQASVCAFPSRWESFGNVVAESSAIGRPVVTSDIPPFRELVDDGRTGRIVASSESRAWAAALIEVLRDRERAQAMGEAGTALVRSISEPSRVADLGLSAHEHAISRWRAGEHAGRRRRL